MLVMAAAVVLVSGLVTLAATPVVGRLAAAVGAVDRPGVRKPHAKPTPRLGGLALMAGVAAGVATLGLFVPAEGGALFDRRWAGLLVGTSIMLAVGVFDDVWPVSPWVKLAAQVLAAAVAVAFGLQVSSISNPLDGSLVVLGPLGGAIAVVWIVTAVNAMNLIDGLDGLCAGVAAIAAAALGAVAAINGQLAVLGLMALIGGTAVGFLFHNVHPARIFLGDSGSLTIGFLLGCGALLAAEAPSTGAVMVVPPVLALALPLADTITAVFRRLLQVLNVVRQSRPEQERFALQLEGRPQLFKADRGHLHHRLLERGHSHKLAVKILWLFSAAAAAAAVATAWQPAVGLAVLAVTVGLCGYLIPFRLRYRELHVLRKGLLLPLFNLRVARREAFHAVLDAAVAIGAYSTAYLVAQGWTADQRPAFWVTLPVVIAVELSAFYWAGLYRGAYRHASVAEVLRVVRSTGLAAAAAALVLAVLPGAGPSVLIMSIVNGLLLTMLVLSGRLSFRLLDYVYGRAHEGGVPTVLYGAGRGGDLALREMLANPQMGWRPLGFLDDLAHRRGRYRGGYPILGGLADLAALARRLGVKQVVVTTDKLTEERRAALMGIAERYGLQVLRFVISWEPIREDVEVGELSRPRRTKRSAASPLAARARVTFDDVLGPITAIPTGGEAPELQTPDGGVNPEPL